ncbi:MAG TPA: phosphatidate cytidylyltransferase [Candidatus Didemnitutus sp.]|nr:phosphatidate cytidylyltransferase [Candidatus Didemnitutus sp.]
MLSRILSTLLLWSVVLASLWYFGADAAVVLLTAIAALTLHEFYRLVEKMGYKPFRWTAIVFAVLMTASPYYVATYLPEVDEVVGIVPGLLVLATILASVRSLGERDGTNRVESIGSTVLGLFFIPFLLQYLIRILLLPPDDNSGLVLCLWVVAVSKFCDVGALLTGLAIGRHKMAPNISPKKTWEGAVGGVLISMGVGAGIAAWVPDLMPEKITPLVAAAVALPLALTTIVSDLIESALKRRADIKDTGKMIPGIGGAFDLSDSLILTAPLAYYILVFLV